MFKGGTTLLITTNTFLLLMILVVGFNYYTDKKSSYKQASTPPGSPTGSPETATDKCGCFCSLQQSHDAGYSSLPLSSTCANNICTSSELVAGSVNCATCPNSSVETTEAKKYCNNLLDKRIDNEYCGCMCKSGGGFHPELDTNITGLRCFDKQCTFMMGSETRNVDCSKCTATTKHSDSNSESCVALRNMQNYRPPSPEVKEAEEELIKLEEYEKREKKLLAEKGNCAYRPRCICDSDCPPAQRCSKGTHVCVQACDNCRRG